MKNPLESEKRLYDAVFGKKKVMPESAREFADEKVVLKYNVDGRWRVQYTNEHGQTISVNNRHDGELARVQIRGIAARVAEAYASFRVAALEQRIIELETKLKDKGANN